MDIRKIISVLCFAFSCNAFADNASPVLFDQILNVKSGQLYELELENVQPSDQIWTAVYLVGRQNYPGVTSKVDFVIDNQGLLNKANANEHAIRQQLIAENLPQTQQYSFNQFKGLKTLLDDVSILTIDDPQLDKTDTVRVYSQVNDWIPEYNSYLPTKVQFSIQNVVDFDIVAAYVLVGKGAKPAQLSELNFNQISSAPVTVQGTTNTVSTVNTIPTAVPPAQIQDSNFSFSRLEMKVIIFMSVAAMMGFFAFINRRKVRRAF